MANYIGKGRKGKFGLLGSICIDDAEKFFEKSKNSKRYLSFEISEMKEQDKYGNTHTIKVREPKKGETVSKNNEPDDLPF
jgi:hypothetical protein